MPGKRLQTLLKMTFGLAVLTWIGWHLEFARLLELARRGDPLHFALGVGWLVFAMIGLQWSRLHLLIKSFTPSLAVSLKIFFIGALFNNFLPSNIGGDAVRLMYLRNLRADGWGTPFMLLLIYRLSSFALLVASGLVYIAVERTRLLSLLAERHWALQLRPEAWSAAAAGLAALGALAYALRRRLSARLRARISEFVRACRTAVALLSAGDRIWLALQTAAFQLCRMLSFYFLVRYMGQVIALWDLTFVVSATALIAVVPVTVAGLGVMEASITGLLVLYGVDLTCAGAVALLNRAVLLLAAVIGGVLYLRGEQPQTAAVSGAKPSPSSG